MDGNFGIGSAGVEFDPVDIFLSYNHTDDVEYQRATDLHEKLKASGFDVWIDKGMQGGEEWQLSIRNNLGRARLVVALLSKRYLASGWCTYEATEAALQKKFWPVTLEPFEDSDIPKVLRDVGDRFNRVSYDHPDLLAQIIERIQPSRPATQVVRDGAMLANLPDVLKSGQRDLFGREREETLLLDAWGSCAPGADPASKTNIVVLHAIGGAGKTALLRRMVDKLHAVHFPHADVVIGWSAYSQGAGDNRNASAEPFIESAIGQIGYTGKMPADGFGRAQLLAKLLQTKRALFLLDGIEPLQSLPAVDGGRLKDKGLAHVVTQLARTNPGLVVITSRQPLPEVASLPAGVRDVALEQLDNVAGAALLKRLGCWGTREQLEAASADADGHALTITALGGYIAAVEGGDIRRRDHFKLGEIAFTAEEMAAPDLTVRAAKKAARIMESYIARFDEMEREKGGLGSPEGILLNLVGLFDRPVEGAAVNSLLDGEPIAGLTDPIANWDRQTRASRLRAARARLVSLSLILPADKSDPEGLDAHPIVRAHFGNRLKDRQLAAFRAANERLYRMYTAEAAHLPASVEAMTPLFNAISHACAAGLHQEAFDKVYFRRIRRGNESYDTKRLGAHGATLGALSNFFAVPWGVPAGELSMHARSGVLGDAAFSLRALGRPAEAEQANSAGLALHVAQGDWWNSAAAACNLSESRLSLGRVGGAVTAGDQAVTYADRCQDSFLVLTMRTVLANTLLQAGQLLPAAALFEEAEQLQIGWRPSEIFLYSLRGYQYCDLLLAQGKVAEASQRAEWIADIYSQHGWPGLLDNALNMLADGRCLAQLAAHGLEGHSQISRRLDEAVTALRRAGGDDDLPYGLLARAEHLRRIGEFGAAGEDLEIVHDIATRGSMKLFLTDFHLESARLCLAQIADAPPETLIPLQEEVEITEPPSPVPPAKQPSWLARAFGAKPAPSPPAPPPVVRKEWRVVSPPPEPWVARTGLLNADERRLLAAAEEQFTTAAKLVQETGYHRRDDELRDLRNRLDLLAPLVG